MTRAQAQRAAPPATDWLSTLKTARTIAVIGASADIRRPGGRAVAALLKFRFSGTVYPVNPGRSEIQGLTCYSSIQAIGHPVDVAFVMVSAERAADVVTECGAAGVRLVILGMSGFSESGAAGAVLQKRLTESIVPGMRVIGPNTNGVVWLGSGAVACFSPTLQQPNLELRSGPIAIVSQSGALGAATFTLAQAAGIDVGLMINTGNELDVGFEEVLTRLCGSDSDVSVVLCYVEGLSDRDGLLAAARSAAARGATLVMLKVGSTEAGAAAAAAHTAKLAGSDRTFGGVCAQLGIVRAASLSQLTELGLAARSHRRVGGGRITVASLSGGLGIIVADAVAGASGLALAHLSSETAAELDAFLPHYLGRVNPLDLGGGPFWDLPVLQRTLAVLDREPDSDMIILAIANFEATQDDIADALEAATATLEKPLVVVWYGSADRARSRLNRVGIPAFAEPVAAVSVVATLRRRITTSSVLRRDGKVDEARRNRVRARIAECHDDVLDQQLTWSILHEYDISVVKQQTWPVDAEPPTLGHFPCYVKLSAPELTHKSDSGAVVLAETAEAAGTAVTDLRELARRLGLAGAEISVQEHVDRGSELLLGMSQDPVFGAVLTLGLGGVLAEALDDVVVRLPVLDDKDVRDMLASLRHQAMVTGFRALPSVDTPAVVALVVNFAQLVLEVGDVLEAVDINPVIAGTDGSAVAVDMLMVRRR